MILHLALNETTFAVAQQSPLNLLKLELVIILLFIVAYY